MTGSLFRPLRAKDGAMALCLTTVGTGDVAEHTLHARCLNNGEPGDALPLDGEINCSDCTTRPRVEWCFAVREEQGTRLSHLTNLQSVPFRSQPRAPSH